MCTTTTPIRRRSRSDGWCLFLLLRLIFSLPFLANQCCGLVVRYQRIPPHNRASLTTCFAKKKANKQPYRLGVYSYRNEEQKNQNQPVNGAIKNDANKIAQLQHDNVTANENVTTAQPSTNNITNSSIQQQETEVAELLLLKQEPSKSFASNIIDSFLDATNEPSNIIDSLWSTHMTTASSQKDVNVTLHSNANGNVTLARNVNATTPKTTIKNNKSSKAKPQPSFFSTWSYDMRPSSNGKSKSPKAKKNVTATLTSTTIPSSSLLANKNPNDVLTVADLDAILRDGGYVRESEIIATRQDGKDGLSVSTKSTFSPSTTTSSKRLRSVAFPQASVLSYKDLTFGSTVAAGVFGMLLGITVAPNLWLIGVLFGSMYGYQVSKDYKNKPTENIVGKSVIAVGRRLAKLYLNVYDWCYGIWFLYKTGQLSYSYYKQYSRLDERFGLQEKMDAWNARFVKGKENFDQWEQNNEIGRRVIAGLRTAWLVEEKRRKQTRYRIVQYTQDAYQWCKRFVVAIWDALTGGGSSNLSEVLKGIRINISESRLQEVGPRVGAAVMALVSITMIGSLYAIAPRFLALLAIGTGIIWPTWTLELWDRLQSLVNEFAAKGRGEEVDVVQDTSSRSGIPASLSQQFGLYDKKRYWYYQREDGSRRWYRTGLPAFRSDNRSGSGGKSKKRTAGKANTIKNNSANKKGGRGGSKGTSNGSKPQNKWGWFS